jgi:hypothetical protein
MTFEEFVARVDTLVTKKKPAFEFAHKSAVPEEPLSASRSATWTQPGGIVNLWDYEDRVRVQALPIVTEPCPTSLSAAAERQRFLAQQTHRFEYWIDKTEDDAERVATDIARHLEGPKLPGT